DHGALVTALNGADREWAVCAALALDASGLDAGLPVLLHSFSDGSPARLRTLVAWSLVHHQDPAVLEAMRSAAELPLPALVYLAAFGQKQDLVRLDHMRIHPDFMPPLVYLTPDPGPLLGAAGHSESRLASLAAEL